jgi:hypothetical protein
MEQVVDKLVAELNTFKATASASGGCSDVLNIEAVYWGDPGLIPSELYPCFTVEPVRDAPEKETTGYEIRDLVVTITVLIDLREYFDSSVDEAEGDRKLVQTMSLLQRWLRRTANRQMDGLAGVREVKVSSTDYNGQVRGSVIAKTAQVSLTVNRQYSRQA